MSKKILIEGKKEEVAKKLKQKFKYDTNFIDQVLNIDPTRYKYVDYLANQLNKIIPQLSGPEGGLNLDQRTAVSDVFYTIIPWFHQNVDKITSDDIWKTETKYRARHGVFDNINNLADNPKDINQYTNPAFLEELMEVVDSRKTNKELERELKSQAEKLYEDENVLVVMPKTYAASCYYGANTKWCTTNKQTSHYFRQYAEKGELYYFINKNDGNKLALFVDTEEKRKEVYNSSDVLVGPDELRKEFPQQIDLIDELLGVSDFSKSLRGFIRKKVSSTGLANSDDGIYAVDEREPLGQSIIIIDFDNDDKFFNSLDLHEDDIWFLNAIESHYSGYEFMDRYTIEDDFKNGYIIFYELNDENKEKLKEIASALLPNIEYKLDDEGYRQQLAEALLDTFENEMDWIIGDYHSEKENEMNATARVQIDKDLNNLLESVGFKIHRKYDYISTTVANLLMWSTRLDIHKTDVISLFNQIIEQHGKDIGGWAENSYEFQDSDNFDSVSFNRTAESYFDKIIDKIENEEGELKNFIEFRKRIESKYKINTWYELPKDKNIKFKVLGFDRDKMKVNVRITSSFKGSKDFSLSEEAFLKLLYQPELFDLFGDDE
jgi:hypothetical protein